MSDPNISDELATRKEYILDHLSHDEDSTLQDIFMEKREYNGYPITKDSFNQLYDMFLEDLTVMDLEAYLE